MATTAEPAAAKKKFEDLAEREHQNRVRVEAPIMTYETSLRRARASCSIELGSGEDILARASKAAGAQDAQALASTYDEYAAHALKVAWLQTQMEALCK